MEIIIRMHVYQATRRCGRPPHLSPVPHPSSSTRRPVIRCRTNEPQGPGEPRRVAKHRACETGASNGHERGMEVHGGASGCPPIRMRPATRTSAQPHTATHMATNIVARIATHTATRTATQTHSHTHCPTHCSTHCPTQTHIPTKANHTALHAGTQAHTYRQTRITQLCTQARKHAPCSRRRPPDRPTSAGAPPRASHTPPCPRGLGWRPRRARRWWPWSP